MFNDLKYAIRLLAKSPGLTLAIVFTLALGIGANTAIFTVANAYLLKPLPFPGSDRLTSVFDRQDRAWRDSVLPQGLPRVAIEAGVTDYWRKYVGLEGEVVGIDRFGESAPAADVYKFLGIDAEHVVAAVQRIV